MNRKPPGKVAAIRGQHKSDVISQQELLDLEDLQRMEWSFSKRAGLASEKIRSRIEHGATVEDGSLYYDGELEMVRTRKAETAAGRKKAGAK